MNPMTVAAGVAAAGLGYLGYKKFGKPTAASYQSMNVVGPGGVPIKVATPVPNTVTQAQMTGIPAAMLTQGSFFPVPTTVPGVGVTYAPPGTINVLPNGDVHQPAPIVISPGGASSVAIGSVKDVQHALNTLGFCKPALVEDGKLGPMTLNCIKAFQSANKLVVDGNAGPATKAALSAALTNMAGGWSQSGATAQQSTPRTGVATTPAGVTVDTTAALKMTAVQVQHSLNILGTTPALVEDGKVGPRSVAAIKSFQTAHGLIPDGVAGPKTKTAIYLATINATH
ncbi:Putative peptidoglycan binding domain protein [uncultured archaeon]|nr:Putative peptidoglycan binding domain protein [uncultured archaeon]